MRRGGGGGFSTLPRPHSWGRVVRGPQNVSAGVRRRQIENLRINSNLILFVSVIIHILILSLKQTKTSKIQGYNAGNRAVLYTVQAG